MFNKKVRVWTVALGLACVMLTSQIARYFDKYTKEYVWPISVEGNAC